MITRITIYIFGVVTLLTSCNSNSQTLPNMPTAINQSSITLTSQEIALCDSLKFDKELVLAIKNQTLGDIEHTPLVDSVTGEVLKSSFVNGLCILSTDKKDYDFVLNNKEIFSAKGYLIFIFGNDWTLKEYITVIKGHDELEAINWRKTNGINHGHDNKTLLNKFKSWKEKNDFWVLGAGLDFVYIKFKKRLENVDLFAKEVYEFCPDAIDQGAGNMRTLVQEIKQMNGMFFWWD